MSTSTSAATSPTITPRLSPVPYNKSSNSSHNTSPEVSAVATSRFSLESAESNPETIRASSENTSGLIEILLESPQLRPHGLDHSVTSLVASFNNSISNILSYTVNLLNPPQAKTQQLQKVLEISKFMVAEADEQAEIMKQSSDDPERQMQLFKIADPDAKVMYLGSLTTHQQQIMLLNLPDHGYLFYEMPYYLQTRLRSVASIAERYKWLLSKCPEWEQRDNMWVDDIDLNAIKIRQLRTKGASYDDIRQNLRTAYLLGQLAGGRMIHVLGIIDISISKAMELEAMERAKV